MKKSAIIALSLLAFTSCQKVIDVDLKDAEPVIVIEGNITDQAGPYVVTISKSVSFSADNNFPAVTGASVILSDDLGNSETLTESVPGTYVTSTMVGTPGRTYTLSVVAEGKTYTAQSTMPLSVSLDSLVVEPGSGFGGDPVYYIIPQWQDSAGVVNYYRCIEYQNGTRVGAFLYDDVFSDGLVNGQPLLNFDTQFAPGDTVTVDFQCMDKATYLYFYSMEQTTSGQTAAPANPVSNFDNGALGYFSAHTWRQRSTIIQ